MATGDVRWRHDFREDAGHATFHGDPLLTDDLVITGTEALTPVHARAFDRRTGRTVWTREGEWAFTRSDVVRAGSLAVGRNDAGELIAVEAATGSPAWRVGHRGARYRPDVAESPAVIGEDIVFSAPDGALYRVEAADGEVVWQTGIGCDASTSVAAAGDDLWVGCGGGTLFRLDAVSGEPRGRLDLNRSLEGRLTLADDLLVVPGGPGWIGAVTRDLGGVVWERADLPRLSVVQPILRKEALITGGADGALLALDPHDGRTLWRVDLEGSIRGLGTAGSAAPDLLLVGTIQGRVYGLRIPEGEG